jgi:hopanoid biosynthesis associated RND transporter like protein HpnN
VLARDHVHFVRVTQPDASPYLARNAFLFLDTPMLRDVLDHTIDAQPFLSQLVADPSLRGLAGAFSLIAQGVSRGQADLTPFLPALRGFQASLAASARGRPEPLSWENLLAGPVAQLAGRYHFVLAKPKLDYGAVQPGADASQAIRQAASRLEFVRDGLARVRLTGSVALDDEEFATVAQGAVWGLLGSAVLVSLWLFLAVGTWRMVVPILLTLCLGLLLTGGFAALAVGTLNVVSVAFAILFIGIAVDFAIQFSVQLRAARAGTPDLVAAISITARRTGLQILVASLATSAGFLAFTPTAFIGVAQLGLIAGGGMLIAFACTMTLLPAFLAVFSPRAVVAVESTGGLGARLGAGVEHHRRLVLAVFGGLALLGLALTPRLGFDSDPLHTKNVHTEAMQTLTDLINDPVTNPYTMEMLVPGYADAASLAARLGKLPLVDSVIWLQSFVPGDQAPKLAMIQDASDVLAATLAEPASVQPVTAAALRGAVSSAARALGGVLPKLPAGHPLAAIHADLLRLAEAPDSNLVAASDAMTRFLPLQLSRLRTALGATPVRETDVPEAIRADWVAKDGRLRLQVTPKPVVRGSAALRAFMEQVQSVAPGSAGSAVTIVQSAATVVGAFRVAAISALAAITLLLIGILRRALDVAMVLAPLLLSSLLTVLVSVVLHMSLNFANIIALPLLLGVGVSFNVYLVMGWRAGQIHPLDSAMARAVAFSALTTGTAFGSLALSHHPGTASMGELLLVSLACMVASTLLFLPALLASVTARPKKSRGLGGGSPPNLPG